jgi:hypothetical protein
VLEREQGSHPQWRQGERKLWLKFNSVIREVQHQAGVWGMSHQTAAAALDSEHPKGKTSQWVRELPPVQKQREENPDGARQQAVFAAVTAAAQPAAAAASEALAAAASTAQHGAAG